MSKDNKVKKSLRVSYWDGMGASLMIGLTQDYIIPYALALKASVKQIGLLSSLPNLCAALIQLKSADFTERLASRKKIILSSVFFQALTLLPIMFIPYCMKDNPAVMLIVFVVIFTGFGAVSLGPWLSLMSEYIPARKRGAYFGWRNRVLGFMVVVSSLSAGVILQLLKHNVLKGFLIILILALIARVSCCYFLMRMYEPTFKHSHESYFSFYAFLKRAKESNFARFVFFVAGLNFCVNIAAPFFAVFMLRDMKLSYITYTLLMVTVPITSLLLIQRWGRLADRAGNIRILKFTACFIASLPLPWIMYRHPVFLIFVQILGGFAWSGFNLCATNFIFDSVSAEKRTRCFSYFNVINGLASSAGALLGGYLATHLPELFGYKLLFLFFVSSTMRFLIVLSLAPRIQEVRRHVEAIKAQEIIKAVVLQ